MTTFKLPTLYKNKQLWNCSVTDDGTQAVICVTHGQVGGKLQDKLTYVSEGKNIGRANETTYYEQAISEAKSKWAKQKDKLYLESNEVYQSFNVRPMLAQSYEKHAHKIQFPCYVQPKLDGIRCLASAGGLYSRQGKQFKVLDHIEAALTVFFEQYPDFILDGELYCHDKDFQSIVSGIKRDEKNDITSQIEYHIYDCIMTDSHTYNHRTEFLHICPSLIKAKPIQLVQTVKCEDADEISTLHNEFVGLGYEGIMLRNRFGLYQPDKRSYDLQKVKSFKDDEFKIVGVEEDKNNQAVFICVTNEGTEFNVKPKGDDELRRSYLNSADELLGKMLTVRFFDYTDSKSPVPRFPVGIAPRNYE